MEGQQGVEVKPSPIGGKGLFTTRAFDAGEAVLELERPLVGILDKGRVGDTCAWCFTWTSLPLYREADLTSPAKVNFCVGCRKVAYCSKRCQAKHWKAVHKQECKSIATIPQCPGVPIAMAQIVRGIDAGDSTCKSVLDMESHLEDFFREGGEKVQAIASFATATLMLLRQSDDRLPLLRQLACIVFSNCSTLGTPTFDPIGMSIDPTAGRANHSCAPNAYMLFDGPKLQLRTLEKLEHGQEILISYVEENSPYAVRQAELKERYHFDCRCTKCQLGADAPQDRFLSTPPGLNDQMAEMPGPFVGGGEENPHQLGTTPELKFLSNLQAFGFKCLEQAHGLGKDLMNTRTGIDLIARSGAWPLTRSPLPALYQAHVPESLSKGNLDAAFLAAMKTYCLIDPVVYPQPHHPVRLVHAWTLGELVGSVAAASGTQSPIVAYATSKGIRLTVIRLRILLESVDMVPLSHGNGSIFARAVGTVWQSIVAAAKNPDEQWMRAIRVEAATGWDKIRAMAMDEDLEKLVERK